MLDVYDKYRFLLLIVSAVINFSLSVMVLASRKSGMHYVFAGFCFSVGFWALGIALFGLSDVASALVWVRLSMFAAVLMPAILCHFVIAFCGKSPTRGQLFAMYMPAFLTWLILALFPSWLVESVIVHAWGKESVTGQAYGYVLLYFYVMAFLLLIRLGMKMMRNTGGQKDQAGLMLMAMGPMLLFSGYFSLLLPWIGRPRFIWIGPYLMTFASCVGAYAIARSRMVDIKLVFIRATLFMVVYTMVLGLPYVIVLRYPHDQFVALTVMALLATLGPFIYLYLRRKTENRLLAEQRKYQATLIQASSGIGKIKDLPRLFKMIVRVVTRTVKVEHTAIYLLDKKGRFYKLGASLWSRNRVFLPENIPVDSALIQKMILRKKIVVADEERSMVDSVHGLQDMALCNDLAILQASLVVPSLMDERMVAFLVLGAKVSGKPYTSDDLSVFSILANQSALAIENAMFYEDVQRTQAQLLKAEKMATIGTMADGLSHQINNRFHAMGFIVSDMQDTLSARKENFSTPALMEVAKELDNGLQRLQDNVTRGGEIVQGLLRYSRQEGEEKSPCDVNKIIDSAYEMVQLKIKKGQMVLLKDFDPAAIPMIRGNLVQLLEVFFNLIDNAYDAMMQRKGEVHDSEYKPLLKIQVIPKDQKVCISFIDNGIGVKKEERYKFFTPFFTTKPSSKKGTGLGLYVIRKIVEESHGGSVEVDSEYMTGTVIRLTLPVVSA